ncbi:hypothetical protein Tco_0277870 [Tanacetum coccineum]
MATIRSCNKHNMIACVEKTAQNADFYQVIDFLTGCSINYSLLVDPDLIGPWLQQFWATATLQVINDVPHIRAKVLFQLFLNKQLEGVDRPQDFMPSVSLPSKVFTFMRKHSTKFSWPASYKGALHSQIAGFISRTADFQGTAESHDAASIPKSPNDFTPTDATQQSVVEEGLLDIYSLNREFKNSRSKPISQANYSSAQSQLNKLSNLVAPVGQTSCSLGRESEPKEAKETTNRRNKEESVLNAAVTTNDVKEKSFKPTPYQFNYGLLKIYIMAAEVLVSNLTKRFEHSGPIQSQPQQPTQALETTIMRRLLEKIQAEWMQKRERTERTKGKILKKEMYKDSKEETTTITEAQPSKKPKLRSETIDELRNYLRVVDFEKNAQDKESLEGISMITELQVIDSPDG